MITKDIAETSSIWLGAAVFFALLTIAPKRPKVLEDRNNYFFTVLGALIAAICATFSLLSFIMPPGAHLGW